MVVRTNLMCDCYKLYCVAATKWRALRQKWGKTADDVVEIEFRRQTSGSICWVTFVVYFLIMASTAWRENMNNEVAGSISTVIHSHNKKREPLTCSSTCKTQSLKTPMRASRSLQSHSSTESSEVKLNTRNLIGVPDIIWEHVRFSRGESGNRV